MVSYEYWFFSRSNRVLISRTLQNIMNMPHSMKAMMAMLLVLGAATAEIDVLSGKVDAPEPFR